MREIFSLVGWTFQLILTIFAAIGIPGLFVLMLVESFGLPPLPSEVILPFAGVLIVEGAPGFNWATVLSAALAGSLVGAYLAYEVGRYGGRALVERWGGRVGLRAVELDRAEEFFRRRGALTVFVCRMIPLARAYISYPAGVAQMDRARFGVYTALGAMPFLVVMVYLGTVLGQHYTVLESYFNYLDAAVVVVVVIGAVVYYRHWRARRAEHRAA